LKQLVM